MNRNIILILLIISFFSIILCGCIKSGPDVQILSVQINPLKKMVQHPNITEPFEIPYYNYFVTLFLNNIGNEDAKTRIDLDIKKWNNDTDKWEVRYKHNSNSAELDLNASEFYNFTINATRYKLFDGEEFQINIKAYVFQDDEWILTDEYEKVFDF